MGHPRPIDQQTVKALSWHLLYGNFRPKLGAERWDVLAETVAAPAFRKMDPDEDCPMTSFNQAVEYIDHELGSGDGAMIEEITKASVDLWASMFRNLVQQLQGRPQKMLDIFCTEVHPYFLNDPGASAVVVSDPDRFVLRMDNGLLEGFKLGLVKGFCEIIGAQAQVEVLGEEYHITWALDEQVPEPSRWALFVNATRLPFLTATAVPVLLGASVAWRHGELDAGLFLLTLLGAACFHIGTNVINDYYDHLSGADEANLTPTPFSGGSRLIQRGLFDPKRTLILALVFFALGSVIGLALTWMRGWQILVFGILGFLLGVLYTAPPIHLVRRGVGELAVGLGFGPVMVVGSYWVQTQAWSNEALLASIPVGILIAAVLYINEISDRHWDDKAGKRTLVTRLPQKEALIGYLFIMASAYLSIALGVVFGQLPPLALLGMLTIPSAWKAYVILRRHHAFPYRLIPANAATIMIHLQTGILLFLGYVLTGILERI